ncbi:hypothetical protein BV20DRAFT_540337 [Pilatotrama ljubarskyi]|nr:hypothetical protein BV20DRAFT_540337 [Pilatotrama ljubarskyi]
MPLCVCHTVIDLLSPHLYLHSLFLCIYIHLYFLPLHLPSCLAPCLGLAARALVFSQSLLIYLCPFVCCARAAWDSSCNMSSAYRVLRVHVLLTSFNCIRPDGHYKTACAGGCSTDAGQSTILAVFNRFGRIAGR